MATVIPKEESLSIDELLHQHAEQMNVDPMMGLGQVGDLNSHIFHTHNDEMGNFAIDLMGGDLMGFEGLDAMYNSVNNAPHFPSPMLSAQPSPLPTPVATPQHSPQSAQPTKIFLEEELEQQPPPKKRKVSSRNKEDRDRSGSMQADDVFGGKPRVAWTINEQETWHRVFDMDKKEIEQPGFRVEVDKGFKRSSADDGFICQKKNHFQCTVAVRMQTQPCFVATRDGLKAVSGLFVNMHGVKAEEPTHFISLEQSQSDRSKKPFVPQPIAVLSNDVTKMTVGRLHFSETTANNMRKKGKPNPDQRYFQLVVTIGARAGDAIYTLASHKSEKIIVRASNPGQFETEQNIHWVKGTTMNSVYHQGNVGINTDSPDEALCVRGNIRMTGSVLQVSDKRVKQNIRRRSTKEQLDNVCKLGLYEYELKEGWASQIGRSDDRVEYGVLAQEVEKAIPGGVKITNNNIDLGKDEKAVDNLMVVNKERIFMENVGAVQELNNITQILNDRLGKLEQENNSIKKAVRRASSIAELRLGLDDSADTFTRSRECFSDSAFDAYGNIHDDDIASFCDDDVFSANTTRRTSQCSCSNSRDSSRSSSPIYKRGLSRVVRVNSSKHSPRNSDASSPSVDDSIYIRRGSLKLMRKPRKHSDLKKPVIPLMLFDDEGIQCGDEVFEVPPPIFEVSTPTPSPAGESGRSSTIETDSFLSDPALVAPIATKDIVKEPHEQEQQAAKQQGPTKDTQTDISLSTVFLVDNIWVLLLAFLVLVASIIIMVSWPSCSENSFSTMNTCDATLTFNSQESS